MKKVIIAGAGPGDPDLISVKALKEIEKSDVILFDALVNPSLLRHARKECKLVFVGKRKGKKEFSQHEINKLIVFYAMRFDKVLRLKGGDPYVFGRGHEELEYVKASGFDVEIIPGISSAISAPSSVGIPITKRGINESFWVVTGTIASGSYSTDILLAAKSTATVIILMGMTHIREIMQLFADHRSSHEPVAVIQNAYLPNQRSIRGNAGTISDDVQKFGFTAPAVIVVGKVVKEGNLFEIVSGEVITMEVGA